MCAAPCICSPRKVSPARQALGPAPHNFDFDHPHHAVPTTEHSVHAALHTTCMQRQQVLAVKPECTRCAQRAWFGKLLLRAAARSDLNTCVHCSILAKAAVQPRASIDESRGSFRRQTGDGPQLGRQSRASRDIPAPSESIRPPGLSDDLWQRFLQVYNHLLIKTISLCIPEVQASGLQTGV